ncbi:MAG: single-stranded-DNA-specific exonuclease RecJ, partial [Candidatus Moraniibacteriota bacterium]
MVAWKYRVENLPESAVTGKYHPVVETLLNFRGYTDEKSREHFLFPNFDRDIHDPFLFLQMDRVVTRIGEAKKKGECIGIFGDFDADGVTSSVI